MSALLGIDTATADTCVAVCEDGDVLAEERIGPAPGGRPRHAAALLAAVERAAEGAGGWERIGSLAIGIGPGSFTGVRIGVATARALAQARELPLVPVHSTEALLGALAGHAGRERDLLAVLDARRGELYTQLAGVGGGPAEEPRLIAPDDLDDLARGLSEPLAAGDGALRFRGELEAIGIAVPAGEDPIHRISAAWLCAAATGAEPLRADEVKPLYLRRPDAELWRERDGRN